MDVWWGDERFLPAGDPERNETQARAALLDLVPLDPARVHPMPATDGPDRRRPGGRPPPAYAEELARAARPGHAALPHFDVLMLGVGEDGHVASVFPEHPVHHDTRPVSAVRGSPKPPPVRTTLTLPAINTAEEVWLVASGADKARAVGMALAGAGPEQLPAAGVAGRRRGPSGCSTGRRRPTCRPGCAACAERGPVRPHPGQFTPPPKRSLPAASAAQGGQCLGQQRLALLRRYAAPSRTPGGSCRARGGRVRAGSARPDRRAARSAGSPRRPAPRRPPPTGSR